MENLSKIFKNTFVADLEHHATIDSTNDRAVEFAASTSVKLPFLVIADLQTAGRGRGANRWWTGAGSLAFSLLLGPEAAGTAGRSGLVALAAGVAVVDALAPLATGHALGIHWPNDVMLDGRKLAGILVEVLPDGKLVIGIGINVNNAGADAPEEVRSRIGTLLDVSGCKYNRTEVLIAVLRQLERQLEELCRSPETVPARTQKLCLQRGRWLRIAQGKTQIEGRCIGIGADGSLLLEVEGTRRAVYSCAVIEVA